MLCYPDHPNQVGCTLQRLTRQLAETKGVSTLPHQEGDHTVPVEGAWRVAHSP
jgi:hypothetical protein